MAFAKFKIAPLLALLSSRPQRGADASEAKNLNAISSSRPDRPGYR